MEAEQDVTTKPPKKRKRSKYAEPTGQEILDKAKREARPSTPAERKKIEAAGQCLLPGHLELPVMLSSPNRAAAE